MFRATSEGKSAFVGSRPGMFAARLDTGNKHD
jgi:hypothetical protein